MKRNPFKIFCEKEFCPTAISPKLKRPRAPFAPRGWCPWARLEERYGDKNKRWSGEKTTIIRHRLSRPGFYHNTLIRLVWPLLWRFIARQSGNPNLPEKEPNIEPETDEVDTAVLVVGGDPSTKHLVESLYDNGVDEIIVAEYGLPINMFSEETTSIGASQKENYIYVGAYEDGYLLIRKDGRKVWRVKSKATVISTGFRDAYPLFVNNDVPGIISSDLAFYLIKDGCLKDKDIAVLGDDARTVRIAEALYEHNNVHVITRQSSMSTAEDIKVTRKAFEVRAQGYPKLTNIIVRTKSGNQKIRTDLLISSVGFHSELEPALQLGVHAGYSQGVEDIVALTGPGGETNVPGVFVSGFVSGSPEHIAEDDARLVGENVASYIKKKQLQAKKKEKAKQIWLQKRIMSLESTFIEKKPRFWYSSNTRGMQFICPCEDILLEDILETYSKGFHTLEKIKRYSALGTGSCQGKYCQINALLVLSYIFKRPLYEIGLFRVRPPLQPISFGYIR